MNLAAMLRAAETSRFRLFLLNQFLYRLIPFNGPHRFRITSVAENRLSMVLPFIRRNRNHINGIHACALATLSEYISGLTLVSRLDATRYRLIMQRLEMDYHYQGKKDAVAEFAVTREWLDEKVIRPLQSNDAVVVTCEVKIHDTDGKHLSTGNVYWQVKEWAKVKTRVKG